MFEATEGVCLNSRLISGIEHERMINLSPRDQEILARDLWGLAAFFAALLLLSISIFLFPFPHPVPSAILLLPLLLLLNQSPWVRRSLLDTMSDSI